MATVLAAGLYALALAAVRSPPKLPKYVHHQSCRFSAEDADGLRGHLAREGYAVVRGVLDEQQCHWAMSLLWDFLERASGLSRADPGTWTYRWPAAIDGGIIPWQVR